MLEPNELRRELTLLQRAGGAQPVADDILTFQFNNQAEWKSLAALATFDHGLLAGLPDDDHGGYALLAGRAGNQTLYGGNAANEDLYLRSTAHATKGTVFIGDDGGDILIGDNAQLNIEAGGAADTLVVDANSRIGIGIAAPATQFHIYHATNDVYQRIETDKVNGESRLEFINDVQTWMVRGGMGAWNDNFTIYDSTNNTYPILIQPGAPNYSFYMLADGRIGIGTVAPAASAKVDITSTTGALLLPRMTTAQRDALTAVNGMIIYHADTGAERIEGYEDGAWVDL